MTHYFKLKESPDPDDLNLVSTLVRVGVLIDVDQSETTEITNYQLEAVSSKVWIFQKCGEHPSPNNSTLTVSEGAMAHTHGLPPGYYYIISRNKDIRGKA